MSNSYTKKVNLSIKDNLLKALKDQGFTITTPPYTFYQGKKKGVTCTLYKSGKLLVQGKNKDEFIKFFLEPEILKEFTYGYEDIHIDHSPHIGVDEAGKGDLFGPLCIASVYADNKEIALLKKIGVKDSKNISAKNISSIAKKISQSFKHHIVKINPLKYNQLYEKFGNLNHLLAWGHATCIHSLYTQTKCSHVIIDKFAHESVVAKAVTKKGIDISLTQITKGEQDIVVAAASILARDAFVKGIEQLSSIYGITLPKGAGKQTVEAAKRFVEKHGPKKLVNVCKMHFKTVEPFLDKK